MGSRSSYVANAARARDRHEATLLQQGAIHENISVLICEDEPRLAQLTAGLLEQNGCRAVTTGSPDAALSAMEQDERGFDVVLLDVELRSSRADSVLRDMRARGILTPVILTSGYPEECIEPALLADPQVLGYLVKPYRIERLISAITTILHDPGVTALAVDSDRA
jgi:DNA-binding response OmpR family regulator